MREKGPTAFVTVQRGCDYRCTFCIVPHTRGPERSRRLEDVVREVAEPRGGRAPPRSRCSGRRSTATTTAQHDFADLLRAVGRRRRHPAGAVHQPVSDRLHAPGHRGDGRHAGGVRARAPAGAERLERGAPAHAAPLHARALSRGRRASCARAVPGITFSTDIIVGFPGETDAQFEETLSLVTDADFDDAYTFKYSVRDGTPAVRLRDHVADEVASARLDRLIEVVRANARRKNVARVGETHEVLVERPARRGDLMLGRTRGNHLVLLDLPGRRGRRIPHLSAHRHHRLHLHRRGRRARPGGPVIRNLVEEHVLAAYESLRPRFPEFCGCDVCRDDAWCSR